MRIALLAGFLATVWSVHGAAIYEHFKDLPHPLEYDYVVVGGGNAGNAVAARLGEEFSVLVLEAGPPYEASAKKIPEIEIPLLAPSLLKKTEIDWKYKTEPMESLGGRKIPYARGQILGGTSAINFMIYNSGPREDFDGYARQNLAPEWSWEHVSKLRRVVENLNNENCGLETTKYNASVYSVNAGKVAIRCSPHMWPMDKKVLDLSDEFPDDFPRNNDVNSGNPLGIGWIQASVGEDGKRSSSATAYLDPKHPYPHFLFNAHVTKIVQGGKSGGLPLFNTVEFAYSPYSPKFRVTAQKEVILSAGAFNTPQILMLSGIGDKTELEKLGIKSIIPLPSVGKHATDHSMIANVMKVNTTETLQKYYTRKEIKNQYPHWAKGKGPLAFTVANQIGFFRLPSTDPILKLFDDPAEKSNSPHYELLFVPGHLSLTLKSKEDDPNNYNTIFTVITSPSSEGTVKLRSSDPFDPPKINPNYLATKSDQHIMIEAVRKVKKIAESKAWKGYFKAYAQDDLAKATSDDDYLEYALDNTVGLWHFSGSARMSKKCDIETGVVDPDFRVKNTAGLRVVDASVFPFVPRAHPMGPIYLIAELASETIKSQANPSAQYQVTNQVPLMD